MNAKKLADGVQFVVDSDGRVTSVMLTPDVWQQIVSELEDAEDRKLLGELAPKLAKGPQGALRWADVERDWT